MSLCVFCGRVGSSEEDVFARWIANELRAGDAGFNSSKSRGRDKRSTRYLGIVTRAACRDCNGGWMSQLEQRTKPILRPAMHGEPVSWAAAQQEIVATWAFKTALTQSRSHPPGLQVVRAEHFRYLYENGCPPKGCSIVTGRYAPRADEEAFAAWAGDAWTSGATPSGSKYEGYRVTLIVGRVLFRLHAFVTDTAFDMTGMATMYMDDEPIDALRTLWPLTGTVHTWPPAFGIDTSGLDVMHKPV